ncbi:MAG: FtsL-like putative cell division protein [Paludibacteraceae bacterium]
MSWSDLKTKVSRGWAERPHITLRDITSGEVFERDFVRRQLLFGVMLVLLSLLLVYNRFAHEADLRRVETLKKELVDVKNTSLLLSKELMQVSRQSCVVEKLREQGSALQLPCEPATEIE